ncbi:MAG: hypothetical protein GF334_05640 [Candidatus Altiarchaeales archaeon]|nr:hypothetical protein [Candidatus Altiarchaeales archaeon]
MSETAGEDILMKKFLQSIELEASKRGDPRKSLAGHPLYSLYPGEMQGIYDELRGVEGVMGLKTKALALDYHKALCLRHYVEESLSTQLPPSFLDQLNRCILTAIAEDKPKITGDPQIRGLMRLHRKTIFSPQKHSTDFGPMQKIFTLLDESAKRGRDVQDTLGRAQKIMSQKPHPKLYEENRLLFSDEKILSEKLHKAYLIHLGWWRDLKKKTIKHAIKQDYVESFLRLRGLFLDPLDVGGRNNQTRSPRKLNPPLASLVFIRNQNLIAGKIYCALDGSIEVKETLTQLETLLRTQAELIKNHALNTFLGIQYSPADYERLAGQPRLLLPLVEAIR